MPTALRRTDTATIDPNRQASTRATTERRRAQLHQRARRVVQQRQENATAALPTLRRQQSFYQPMSGTGHRLQPHYGLRGTLPGSRSNISEPRPVFIIREAVPETSTADTVSDNPNEQAAQLLAALKRRAKKIQHKMGTMLAATRIIVGRMPDPAAASALKKVTLGASTLKVAAAKISDL